MLCHHARTAEEEAEWIAWQTAELHDRGVEYRDMTVLYRAHYVTRSLEEVLQKRKIPYTIYSGVQFFGRAEIKDALCYLRMIVYQDDLSFRRIANVPKRNLGISRMKRLEEYASENSCSLFQALRSLLEDEDFRRTKARQFVTLIDRFSQGYVDRPISELLSALLNESGYEEMLRTEGSQERLDNLAELKQSIYEYETGCGEEATAEHYLTHVALFTNQDSADAPAKLKLMTVHAAKGLEFPYVFLCGMNEGVFPSGRVRTLPGMEEERGLAFVAMTRAEKRLYLSEAEGRNLDGSPRYPSRFILDIDSSLLEYTEQPRDGLIRDAREYISTNEKFLPEQDLPAAYEVGQRVRHAILGTGTVSAVDMDKSAYMIKFDSLDTQRRISFRVKLEAEEAE